MKEKNNPWKYELRNPQGGGTLQWEVPYNEKATQEICHKLGVENRADTLVSVVQVNDQELNRILEGKTVLLEELSYLGRMLDSLGDFQLKTFFAVAEAWEKTSCRDLINLTFNLPCYSLVESSWQEGEESQGKLLMEHQFRSSEEAQPEMSGALFLEELRQTSAHRESSYGTVYRNGNQEQTHYSGTNFPELDHNYGYYITRLKVGEKTELLYLPCEETSLKKSMERLGVQDKKMVEMELLIREEDMVTNALWKPMTGENFLALNKIADFLLQEKMEGTMETDLLEPLVESLRPHTPEEIWEIIEQRENLEFTPYCDTAEEYGSYHIISKGYRNDITYDEANQFGEEALRGATTAIVEYGMELGLFLP